MKIFVTGGAGFIGSNFIRYILKNYLDIDIINYDKLTYAGNLYNLRDVENNPRYIFVKGDICNQKLVDEFVKQEVDQVINFAAESHVDRSIEDPASFIQTNVFGTHVLLEVTRKYDVGKYVQISTDEVYGSLGKTGYFTEETPINPRSPYSASKASADLLVKAYHETYGLPINITRCSNNYGPYQFPEKLIPLMMGNILNGKKLPIYGDGKNVRDWIYVIDHCIAIDKVIKKGKIGEIYNIGASNEIRNIDLVKLLIDKIQNLAEEDIKYKKVLKTNIENINYNLINFVKDRLGHDFRYAIDSTKIKREVGWEPKITFEEGIDKTVRWYLENTSWIKKIQSGEYEKYDKKLSKKYVFGGN